MSIGSPSIKRLHQLIEASTCPDIACCVLVFDLAKGNPFSSGITAAYLPWGYGVMDSALPCCTGAFRGLGTSLWSCWLIVLLLFNRYFCFSACAGVEVGLEVQQSLDRTLAKMKSDSNGEEKFGFMIWNVSIVIKPISTPLSYSCWRYLSQKMLLLSCKLWALTIVAYEL